MRSERALTLALAEMYVQGVSTCKVKAITEQLCGVNVSSSTLKVRGALVGQAAAQMDAELDPRVTCSATRSASRSQASCAVFTANFAWSFV